MIDYKIIGERLKKARIDKNLSQRILSNKLDISIAFLSRIERGSTEISLKRLSQICEILEVTEGSILNGSRKESDEYLTKDFKNILDKCNKEQKKLIYEISKIIVSK